EAAEMARADADKARREAEETLIDMHTASGFVAGERGNLALAALWFANAARLARNDPERERANRVRVRTYGRQSPMLLRARTCTEQPLRELAFHSSGRYLLVNAWKGCTLWDLDHDKSLPWPGQQPNVSYAAWGPDGEWLVTGTSGGEVDIVRFPGGERLD